MYDATYLGVFPVGSPAPEEMFYRGFLQHELYALVPSALFSVAVSGVYEGIVTHANGDALSQAIAYHFWADLLAGFYQVAEVRKAEASAPELRLQILEVTMRFLLLALALTACSHTTRAPSSTVQSGLFVNGNPWMNPALELVRGARKTLDIEIYEMGDATFLEAVREANRNGVKVRIIKDPYPVPSPEQCIWFPGLREADPTWAPDPKGGPQDNKQAAPSCVASALPLIKEVREKGGQVVPFYKPHLCGQDERPDNDGSYCYEHGKMIIADGVAMVSSGNFNKDNFCDMDESPKVCNRDFSYVTRNSAEVSVLQNIFDNDLKQTRYPLHPIIAPDTSLAPTVTASPYSLAPLVDFIRKNATGPGHYLQIENQYLHEKNLNAAIQDAAKSGAKVEVMVASLCAFGKPDDAKKADPLAEYKGFVDAGVQFKFFPAGLRVHGNAGYLHAKAMVIDKKLAWMGSVNGSNSALNTNREFGLFFQDDASVKLLSKTLADDFTDPAAETFDESWACARD